ncbi:MAG TPA: cytochrome c [Thermoanaerobaculia bacterium]|nr:cytochrome c [Thermoanaerobaculia bacterium]
MFVLAWLLVISLFFLVAFIAVGAVAELRSAPARWLRAATILAGGFFAVIAALLLWETGLHAIGGGMPSAEASQATLVPTKDPFAAQGPAVPAQGRKLYLEAGCHRCHSIGAGTLLGPDLIDAGAKYDEAFLIRWILDPEGIYRELGVTTVNPGFTPMPASAITEDDAVLIARYLQSFAKK